MGTCKGTSQEGTVVIQRRDDDAQTTMVMVQIWRGSREVCWRCFESKIELWDRQTKMRRKGSRLIPRSLTYTAG